jgi:hypothetical protein
MRLYTAVITDIPEEAKIKFSPLYPEALGAYTENYGYSTWDEAGELIQDPSWKPAGWTEFIDEFAAAGVGWAADCRDDDYTFFWPKISGEYKSQSTAKGKAKLAERWGATVTILEAEVGEFIPVEAANALRKRRRDNARIAKLREQIKAIEDAAA